MSAGGGLPDIPHDIPPGLRRFLVKLKETVEVRNAQVGSPLDANPTYRDLIDAGLIKVSDDVPLLAAGREFRLNTSTWLTSNIPDWVTDNTLPPTPTGFVVVANTSVITLIWDEPVFSNYKQTLIYRSTSNDLSTARAIGSNTGHTYVDDLPTSGSAYYYWIRHESKSELLSNFNDTNGTTVSNAPAAPTVSHAFAGENLVLSWTTPTSNLTIQYYEVSFGASPGANPVGISQSNALRVRVDYGGTRKYWVRAVDINFGLGTGGSVDVTVSNPGKPTITQSLVGSSLALSVSSTPGSLPISYYDIRYGASFAGGTPLGVSPATRYELNVNWTGSRTFYAVAVDSAGNSSSAGSSTFNLSAPTVSSVTAQVVDNNVLLRWLSTQGTLPIKHYNVYRDSTLIGTDAALFAAVFESSAGSFVYKIEPIDSAGNVGTYDTTAAVVAQPPDFVLYDSQDSTFTPALGYHLSLPGTAGNYASTPDSAAVSITGDIDIRVKVAADDWTPAAIGELLSKNDSDAAQFSYLLRLNTTGSLTLYWSADGSALINQTSTASVSAADGAAKWVRATLDVNNGAGGYTVRFYTSDDGEMWTQLGSDRTTAGATSIFNGTSSLKIGVRGAAGTTSPFAGKVYYAEVRNGIDGLVVAKFDPENDASLGDTEFVSSDTGERWTINGADALITADNTTVFYDRDTGTLFANVDTTETFAEHFTSRGWSSPQDQIDAGYDRFLVGKTTGSYEEKVDYGTTIPSTSITMSPTTAFSDGTVTMTPTISTSPDDISYTDFAGVFSAYSTAFRYVKYLLEFSATHDGTGLADDTSNLIGLNPLTYTLDVKLKTTQGVVTAASGDAGGTSVDITGIFIDVQAITLTPLSTTAKHPTYDFTDAPNPTSFSVYLWDAAGARASGDVSYTVRGV